MDTNKLEAFLTVAKYQNFTKASEELFISQPALSKKIADFENEIDAKLLKRNNRKVELTEAGRMLYEEAPSILHLLNELQKQVHEASQEPEERLHIVCAGLEYGRFEDVLTKFKEAYPDIKIYLEWMTARKAKEKLLSNIADVTFQMHEEVALEKKVSSIPFCDDTMAIVLGHQHPLADRKQLSLRELQGEAYISIKSADRHAPFNETMRFFNTYHFQPQIKIVDCIETMVLQVNSMVGFSTLSMGAKKAYGGLLTFVPMVDPERKIRTDLVWNKDNENESRKKFVKFVQELNQKEHFE